MNNKQICLILVLAGAILFAACDNPAWIIADNPPETPFDVPPYVISKPLAEIGERINSFKCAGITFKLLNNANEAIDRITVCFMLYDSKTQANPFMGSNVFEITKRDYISPNENKEICISLDQFIYIVPADPYIIDFFYIQEIHYIDGTVWQDEHGKYRVRW